MTTEEEFIDEVLDLFHTKLKNGGCTKSQTDAVYRVISENLPIFATADEIADHYGKSRDAVHSIIKNRLIEKPKRNGVQQNNSIILAKTSLIIRYIIFSCPSFQWWVF